MEDKERLKIAKRQRDYWVRRRTVQAAIREGSYIFTPKMTHTQLWDALGASLHSALMTCGDGTDVTLTRDLVDAWELYSAIRERGVQLTLL